MDFVGRKILINLSEKVLAADATFQYFTVSNQFHSFVFQMPLVQTVEKGYLGLVIPDCRTIILSDDQCF